MSERPAGTLLARSVALGFAALCAGGASFMLAQAAFVDGFGVWDGIRVALILLTTAWLAWGAAQALVGLPAHRRSTVAPPLARPHRPTVLLIPICNEDPVQAFARVAAMDRSMLDQDLSVDIAILSDTRDGTHLAREKAAFSMLLQTTGGAGRIYYRNRRDNRGRKAGNIEDFVRKSGGAYEFAVVLDADSLMEGETVAALIARMEAEPDLGLLQTLPRIVGAASLFGRAMQFAASFHSPVFARGLSRLQGRTGPFWGHNAIVRMKALAECCGLPELEGPPPFGGTILSHDYVEAALLARGGWRVAVDDRLGGSFEEGPDNLIAYARRDRRWCQGNLQHMRLVDAPGLHGWSRFVFVQGIVSYLVSILWGAFLVASIVATVTAPPPDYFPEPYQLFPVFPDDRTREIVALAIGIGGLLLVPKFAVWAESVVTCRVVGFGGALRALASVTCENPALLADRAPDADVPVEGGDRGLLGPGRRLARHPARRGPVVSRRGLAGRTVDRHLGGGSSRRHRLVRAGSASLAGPGGCTYACCAASHRLDLASGGNGPVHSSGGAPPLPGRRRLSRAVRAMDRE